MIASEDFCDVFEGECGGASDDVNGDMTGEGDIIGSLFAFDIFHGDVVALGDIFDDLFRDNGGRYGTRNDTRKDVTRGIHGDFGAVDEAVRAEFFDDAFELTDVALDVFTEKIENVIGEADVHQLRLALEDGDTEFGIRRLDIDDQTAFKTALDTFFEMLDILGGTVGSQNDLFSRVVEGVEGMEKILPAWKPCRR